MNNLICKFRVTSVQPRTEGQTEISTSHAVYDPQNADWAKATPYGQLVLHIDNAKAMGVLQPGQEFFLEIRMLQDEAGGA